MNILKALMGKDYPKFESTVYADGCKTIVTVSRTLSPDHVDLDSPTYVQNKFKKQIPILDAFRLSESVFCNFADSSSDSNKVIQMCNTIECAANLNSYVDGLFISFIVFCNTDSCQDRNMLLQLILNVTRTV